MIKIFLITNLLIFFKFRYFSFNNYEIKNVENIGSPMIIIIQDSKIEKVMRGRFGNFKFPD